MKVNEETIIDEEDEEVEYKVFKLKDFSIRVSVTGLENFLKKKKLTEGDLLYWVQTHMKPKWTIEEGAYDKQSKLFLNHIFKDRLVDIAKKLEEEKKQRKLTEA